MSQHDVSPQLEIISLLLESLRNEPQWWRSEVGSRDLVWQYLKQGTESGTEVCLTSDGIIVRHKVTTHQPGWFGGRKKTKSHLLLLGDDVSGVAECKHLIADIKQERDRTRQTAIAAAMLTSLKGGAA